MPHLHSTDNKSLHNLNDSLINIQKTHYEFIRNYLSHSLRSEELDFLTGMKSSPEKYSLSQYEKFPHVGGDEWVQEKVTELLNSVQAPEECRPHNDVAQNPPFVVNGEGHIAYDIKVERAFDGIKANSDELILGLEGFDPAPLNKGDVVFEKTLTVQKNIFGVEGPLNQELDDFIEASLIQTIKGETEVLRKFARPRIVSELLKVPLSKKLSKENFSTPEYFAEWSSLLTEISSAQKQSEDFAFDSKGRNSIEKWMKEHPTPGFEKLLGEARKAAFKNILSKAEIPPLPDTWNSDAFYQEIFSKESYFDRIYPLLLGLRNYMMALHSMKLYCRYSLPKKIPYHLWTGEVHRNGIAVFAKKFFEKSFSNKDAAKQIKTQSYWSDLRKLKHEDRMDRGMKRYIELQKLNPI